MVKYLEAKRMYLPGNICLQSYCSRFCNEKQKPINKIMYFVNNLGIVVLSNLIVWTEGCYVDENNLSGSAITFILNICNIVFLL